MDPERREICNSPNASVGPSWGGAILMGSTRSIDPDGANFTLEQGELFCVLEKVIFHQNIAYNGGAVAFVRASLLQLDDVHFVANKGIDGGAMFLQLDGDPHPQVGSDPLHYVNGTGLLFQKNVAERGGAVYIQVQCGAGVNLVGISPYIVIRVAANAAANNEDAVFIENSEFIANSAILSGGAWHVNSGRVGCLSCNFSENIVEGGSDTDGGAIAIENRGALHARNVTFMQNSANRGGGIHARDSLVDMWSLISLKMWQTMVVGSISQCRQLWTFGWDQSVLLKIRPLMGIGGWLEVGTHAQNVAENICVCHMRFTRMLVE